MFPVPRVVHFVTPLLLGSSLFVSGAASAQVLQQTLKDVWVASSTSLYQANYDDDGDGVDERGVLLKNAGDSSRSFEALAFELPSFDTFGGSSTPFRNLVAIDDSRLVRFENGSNETPPKLLFDAGGSPSNLKSVNTVAVTPAGTLLISGYSKSKKVFELWEVTKLPVDNANQQVVLRATGTPQLTDSVFVSDGIVAGSTLGNGGLLAAAGKQVLFFPVPATWNPANTTAKLSFQVLAETSGLPVKNNTVLTSAELVRGTDVLMIATSERTLLTRPVPGGAVTKFATLPSTANGVSCTNLKAQRVLVRSARSGEQKASVVSDICGEVLRYSFTNPSTASTTTPDVLLQAGLVAIAVGEGNQIVCPVNDPNPCMLTTGFEAEIQSSFDSELLVLQFNNLCDPRVSGSACPATTQVLPGNVLNFNSALPAAIQAQIKNVHITIPPYMYGAGAGGKFGALLVRADAFTATSKAAVDLEIVKLIGFELGVRNDFPRLTPMDQLLRQDIAAYAPDTSDYLTVREAEATPIVTGVGSLGGSLRGWSAVIYGLRYDFNAGNPPQSDAGRGARCDLRSGSQQFTATPDQRKFFANLSACLFDDEEDLLTSVIPNAAFAVPSNRNALLADLALVEDKLLKALQSTQPSLGSQTFNALITQLDHFDATVAATAFNQGYVIYKNELQARSAAFRFNVIYRTLPSMPLGGF